MRYAVVVEKTGNGYSAYVPDLPGCIAAANTRVETERLIESAVREHVQLLREGGDPVPQPTTRASVVEVA